jgi:hypothetical protein
METYDSGSFRARKVWILVPQGLFEKLQLSGHFDRTFDSWGCNLIYQALVAEGFIEAPKPVEKVSVKKKPRKANVSPGVEAV